jgi:hypothetical protein
LGAAFAENVPVLDHIYKNSQLTAKSYKLIFGSGKTDVLTWMKKNGIPFPENFRSMIQNSENLETLLWLIKQELDAEFRGIWREVEEVVDLLVPRVVEDETQIVEEAKKVVDDGRRVEEFIHMVLGILSEGKEFKSAMEAHDLMWSNLVEFHK